MNSTLPFNFQSARRRTSQGFTLIEMLVVMAIIGILLVLTSLGLQAVLGTAFGSEASDLANTLVRARAYAMANNTYVFVGIEEVDGSVAATAPPQAGLGRIAVAVVASSDGTRGYPVTTPGPPALADLSVVAPLRRFENVHLLGASLINAAKLPNYSVPAIPNNTDLVQSVGSATTFPWPLNGALQYAFGAAPGSVIQFNPQGEAQIIPATATDNSYDSVLKWIELDLQPTHGKTVPAPGTPAAANAATIFIDGPSGSVTLYRT